MSGHTQSDEHDARAELMADIKTAGFVTGLGLLLAVAPWPSEQPHLIQKLGYLFEGSLSFSRPMDIFDLVLHGGPIVVALVLWVRVLIRFIQSR